MDDVKTIILSGLRATVIMDGDTKLDEKKVKAALTANKMGFESMEMVQMARPKAAYVVNVSGAT